MSTRTLSRPRAALLVALFALAALAAAVLTPPPPVNAAPPGDLALILPLIEDSDDIVPPGGTARVRANLASSTSHPDTDAISGMVRVSGSQEWDHNGRSAFPIAPIASSSGPNDASTGWVVAVQERTAAEGGDIVVVGARHDDVIDPDDSTMMIDKAGSADLYVGGKFIKRLTAPTPVTAHRYGQSVAVGGGLIVVGAHGPGTADARSAVYIYDTAGDLQATLTPAAAVVSASNNHPMFGTGVAISDDGNTIAVAGRRGYGGQRFNGAVYVFAKPSTGWADADSSSAAAALTSLRTSPSRESGREPGAAVAISGDGTVVAVGAPFRDTDITHNPPGSTIGAAHNSQNGGVLVFVRPNDGTWVASTTPTATLVAADDIFRLRLGGVIDINNDGSVIVANGNGRYGDVIPGAVNRISGGNPVLVPEENAWAGAAYVWVKGAAWSDQSDGFKLTDSDGVPGDLFGHKVAVSDSGNRVIVSNAWKSANNFRAGEAHVFDKPAGGWADDDEADIVLTSPQSEEQLFFGFGVAIDGEDTVVVAQNENIDFLSQIPGTPNIFTGHGRAYGFDLSAADPQWSTTLFSGGLTCTTRTIDRLSTWTCPVGVQVTPAGGEKQDPSIIIPLGTPEEAFTISASLTITADGQKINGERVVTIGTVDEVHSAKFDFATNTGSATTSDDDEPYDSIIPAGDETRLQLSILNANGKASAANSVSSVLFTSSGAGAALTLVNPAGAGVNCGGQSCQVDVSKLNAANSDKITVALAHPGAGKSGSATVSARVTSNAGNVLEPESRTVIFSGPVETIAIAEPTTGVLNVNTESGIIVADDNETQDRLRLAVSGADKNGNKAATPTNLVRITVTDPDGKPVRAGSIMATFPVQAGGKNVLDADDNPLLELDVDAPDTEKLESGEYTVELRTGGLTTTQTFTVSGGAANIAVSEPEGDLTVNGSFTVTATLTDASGAAVPDGTVLSFEDSATGTVPVFVNLSRGIRTEDGQASATYLVISAGRGYVTVKSGTASTATLVTTSAAVTTPTEPTNPADSLSTRRVNAFSTWTGTGTTTASALLTGLDNGIDTILLWSNGAWLRYGISDGRKIPGSMDFEVRRGAILWLGNGNGG